MGYEHIYWKKKSEKLGKEKYISRGYSFLRNAKTKKKTAGAGLNESSLLRKGSSWYRFRQKKLKTKGTQTRTEG